jgi:hypothetical protein
MWNITSDEELVIVGLALDPGGHASRGAIRTLANG